jgi:hypothetical protein
LAWIKYDASGKEGLQMNERCHQKNPCKKAERTHCPAVEGKNVNGTQKEN